MHRRNGYLIFMTYNLDGISDIVRSWPENASSRWKHACHEA